MDNTARRVIFPAGTVIPANGHLLVWADEDVANSPGLHANFKLSASGESLWLVASAASGSVVLDKVTFGKQADDISWGRSPDGVGPFQSMAPTPLAPNP